jgi:transcriptional regulator with XRE-family HTH domain/quercetin dioxygenase-like cupin family protein
VTGSVLPPIGERLREARQQRGVTVRGLARAIDVSASLISQIETGKSSPSVSTLYAITAALDISIEDVFGGVGERVAGAPNGASAEKSTARGLAGIAHTAALPVPAAVIAGSGMTPGQRGVALDADRTPASVASSDQADAHASSADRSSSSAASQGLRRLQHKRRVGPVVAPNEREVLHLDSGVTWELLGQLPDTHVDFLRITYAPGGSSSGAGVLMRHSGTEWGHVLAGQLTLTLGFDSYVLNPGDSVSFDCSTPHSYANHGVEPAVGVWFVAERYR